jgi:hypothetical protein
VKAQVLDGHVLGYPVDQRHRHRLRARRLDLEGDRRHRELVLLEPLVHRHPVRRDRHFFVLL